MLVGGAWIRGGRAHRVLAGGADGLCRLTFSGFNALGAVAQDACRPFDRRRMGLGLGEGAAFLVLESETSAKERGATVLAELAGWGVGSEAHHITIPEKEGRTAASLIRKALERGRVAVSDLDYVNAHGTGTPLNDAMEAAALRKRSATRLVACAFRLARDRSDTRSALRAPSRQRSRCWRSSAVRSRRPEASKIPNPACDLVHVMGKGAKHASTRGASPTPSASAAPTRCCCSFDLVNSSIAPRTRRAARW